MVSLVEALTRRTREPHDRHPVQDRGASRHRTDHAARSGWAVADGDVLSGDTPAARQRRLEDVRHTVTDLIDDTHAHRHVSALAWRRNQRHVNAFAEVGRSNTRCFPAGWSVAGPFKIGLARRCLGW